MSAHILGNFFKSHGIINNKHFHFSRCFMNKGINELLKRAQNVSCSFPSPLSGELTPRNNWKKYIRILIHGKNQKKFKSSVVEELRQCRKFSCFIKLDEEVLLR